MFICVSKLLSPAVCSALTSVKGKTLFLWQHLWCCYRKWVRLGSAAQMFTHTLFMSPSVSYFSLNKYCFGVLLHFLKLLSVPWVSPAGRNRSTVYPPFTWFFQSLCLRSKHQCRAVGENIRMCGVYKTERDWWPAFLSRWVFALRLEPFHHLPLKRIWNAFPGLYLFNQALPLREESNKHALDLADVIGCTLVSPSQLFCFWEAFYWWKKVFREAFRDYSYSFSLARRIVGSHVNTCPLFLQNTAGVLHVVEIIKVPLRWKSIVDSSRYALILNFLTDTENSEWYPPKPILNIKLIILNFLKVIN